MCHWPSSPNSLRTALLYTQAHQVAIDKTGLLSGEKGTADKGMLIQTALVLFMTCIFFLRQLGQESFLSYNAKTFLSTGQSRRKYLEHKLDTVPSPTGVFLPMPLSGVFCIVDKVIWWRRRSLGMFEPALPSRFSLGRQDQYCPHKNIGHV